MLRAFQLCVSVAAALVIAALCAWAGGALEPARAAGDTRAGADARPPEKARMASPDRASVTSAHGSGVGTADTATRTTEADYPRPEDRPEIPVGDALDAAGQPLQLSLFTTRDRPEEVLSWYQQQFEKRGLEPVGAVEGGMAHVTAYDPEDGMQRFVTALGQGQGETLVLLGVTNPRRAPRLVTGAKSAPFPVPPEPRGYFGYGSRDGTTQAFSAQFVTRLAAREVVAFYRRELGAQGYVERSDSNAALVLFGKGPVLLSVAVQALDDKGGAAVFVNRTEGAP